jgi:DNA adenine methylase
VRDDVESLIVELERLAQEHERRGEECYYEVRDRRFNPLRRETVAGATGEYPTRLAAMLIYLNRTGYNGLYRLNAKGDFNVPAGRYKAPRICDGDNLRLVSRALRRRGVSLLAGGFESVLASARPGDFVYVDPPYAPLSPTARFTAYTAGGFAPAEQVRLRDVIVAIARRGCHVLLSNSTAPQIRELYVKEPAARAAGLRAYEVEARRAISSRAGGRGPIAEFLISNVDRARRTRTDRAANGWCKL